MKIHQGNAFIGLGIGIFLPCLAYYILVFLFTLAANNGIIDEAPMDMASSRFRTITLIAICANILPLQLFSRRKENKSIKGLVTATLILAGVWMYFFYSTVSQ